jgi:nicotinic acid mononucleotide adenylyltransferase
MALVHHALEQGFDEVVLLPGAQPAHKPGATALPLRIEMIAARLEDEPRVNVYTGDSSVHHDRFGLASFVRRIQSIYGTEDVTVLVGQDAYETGLLPQGQVRADTPHRYWVFPREGHEHSIFVPESARDRVIVGPVLAGNASRDLRRQIREGTSGPIDGLHPRVLDVIRHHVLYR